MTTKPQSRSYSRRSAGILLLVGVLVGVTISSSVSAAPSTKVTWKVSSLPAGEAKKLSAVVSTNSPGVKTWSKRGTCTLTPTRKPTRVTMGATGSCTLTLKIAQSKNYPARTSRKTIALVVPATTVAPTTTVAPATLVAPTTTTTVAPVASPVFGLSSSSESKVQNVAIVGYTITSTGGVIASYAISPVAPTGTLFDTSTGLLSGSPTTVQGATVYTITATNATGTATRTFTLTVTALPCADGGACVADNIGPGGGTVYYVASSNFTSAGSACGSTCRYLETAPIGWIAASTQAAQTNCVNAGSSSVEPKCVWSGNTSAAIGSMGTRIGTGYANTSAMITQSSTAGKAGTVARAFQGGGKTDWFLPSKDELNALCKWATNDTVNTICNNSGSGGYLPITKGEFANTPHYWSSTELDAGFAWYQNFNSGNQGSWMKGTSGYLVRPVRAF